MSQGINSVCSLTTYRVYNPVACIKSQTRLQVSQLKLGLCSGIRPKFALSTDLERNYDLLKPHFHRGAPFVPTLARTERPLYHPWTTKATFRPPLCLRQLPGHDCGSAFPQFLPITPPAFLSFPHSIKLLHTLIIQLFVDFKGCSFSTTFRAFSTISCIVSHIYILPLPITSCILHKPHHRSTKPSYKFYNTSRRRLSLQ